MPFKSKAQRRLFWAKENRGELPKKTVLDWEHATKNKKALPEHVKQAHQHGRFSALKLIGLGLVILSSGCTFFDTAEGKDVLNMLIQTAVLIVTPLALMFVKQVVATFEKKTGLAVDAHQVDLLNKAVMHGIALAREQSRKQLKLNSPPLTGEVKRDIAVKFAIDTISQHNGPEVASDYLVKLIEAQLNMTRPDPDPYATTPLTVEAS